MTVKSTASPGNAESIPTSAIPADAVAAINHVNALGMTPLLFAVTHGNPDVVELLLRFECCEPVVFSDRYSKNSGFASDSGAVFDRAMIRVGEGACGGCCCVS